MPGGDLPDFSIWVNGTALPPQAQSDVRSITVTEDLRALSMFTLSLCNWDDAQLAVSWSDSPLFAVGNEVQISLGYIGDLAPVMLAEITSLEPGWSAGEQPGLLVRGYDLRHRLARGRRTSTFTAMTDDGIARLLAEKAGLTARAQPTEVTYDYVIQANQSDWEFLRRRADLIGYEVFVRDRTLYFRPPQSAAGPSSQLSVGEDITEFSPRLSTLAQDSAVAVRGWDAEAKRAVLATSDTAPAPAGQIPGPQAAARAFGPASVTVVGQRARSAAAAGLIASGQFAAMALAYVEGEVTARGQQRLRAGTVVDISGAGQAFSGPYYVTSVTHTLTAEHGYQTSFTVQRNATR